MVIIIGNRVQQMFSRKFGKIQAFLYQIKTTMNTVFVRAAELIS